MRLYRPAISWRCSMLVGSRRGNSPTKNWSIQWTARGSLFGRTTLGHSTHVNPNKGDIGKMEDKKNKKPPEKEWTLMFFFASDNNLSASMFYQLKSMKTAGFQKDTNVLAHFDPHERGMPSMIFEINRMEKE